MKVHLLVLLLPLTLAAHSAKAYDNDYCREFTKQVRVGGQLQNAYGTACYRPDGSWEVVQEPRVRPQYGQIIHSDDRYDHDRDYGYRDWGHDDWRDRPSRPPVIVNYWENRWTPGWDRRHHNWRKPCYRKPVYGYGYGHPHRYRGNSLNISYSF